MKEIRHGFKWGLVVVLGLLMASSLRANPIIVSINDVPNAAPVIQVQGAPNGYVVWPGSPPVADPAIEEGALINLIGVDTAAFPGDENALPDWGGRLANNSTLGAGENQGSPVSRCSLSSPLRNQPINKNREWFSLP